MLHSLTGAKAAREIMGFFFGGGGLEIDKEKKITSTDPSVTCGFPCTVNETDSEFLCGPAAPSRPPGPAAASQRSSSRRRRRV